MPDQEAKGSYLDRFESLPGRPMPGPDLSMNEAVGFLPAHPKLRMSSDFIFDAKIELFTRLGDSRKLRLLSLANLPMEDSSENV